MNNIKEYFFLKKYIPIYKAFNKICIGFVGSDNYLEIDYSKNNYNLLESLLKEGVEESYIEKTSLYSELHTKNFLEINPLMLDQYSSRSELYLEYLLNRNISKDINIVKDKTILIFGA